MPRGSAALGDPPQRSAIRSDDVAFYAHCILTTCVVDFNSNALAKIHNLGNWMRYNLGKFF